MAQERGQENIEGGITRVRNLFSQVGEREQKNGEVVKNTSQITVGLAMDKEIRYIDIEAMMVWEEVMRLREEAARCRDRAQRANGGVEGASSRLRVETATTEGEEGISSVQ